jgi:hypothetical protein
MRENFGRGPVERKLRSRLYFWWFRVWPDAVLRERLNDPHWDEGPGDSRAGEGPEGPASMSDPQRTLDHLHDVIPSYRGEVERLRKALESIVAYEVRDAALDTYRMQKIAQEALALGENQSHEEADHG